MEERLSFLLQFPELNLPILVGIIGGIVIFVLMVRAPENRKRLLPLGILLPLHALLFPLAFLLPDFVGDNIFVTYVLSTSILLFGLIAYLWVLSRRKRLNRAIWTAATIWFLYFAAILFMIIVVIILAHDMSH